jgi:hypothetical protein
MGAWEPGPGIVVLPGGRTVRGRGLRRPAPADDPDFGLYLTGWDPGPFPWARRWVRWPDLRTPSDPAAAIAALGEAFERAAAERVEVACGGGVGRTGCGLAVMAIWSGVPSGEAVAWVRAHYHPRAVETPWQRRWVRRVGRR